MPLKWDQSLATGIREIDLQHQELIGLINELERAQLAVSGNGDDAAGRAALAEVLPRLSSYVLFHFGTEESMMETVPGRPPHVEKHLQEHRRFAERVAALKGREVAPEELAAFVDYLKRWIVEHIQRTDRELSTFIL